MIGETRVLESRRMIRTATRQMGRRHRCALYVTAAGAALALSAGARADTGTSASMGTAAPVCSAKRPQVMFNRWQEDWSVLANPCVPREPLDGLKYMPLGGDPDVVSLARRELARALEVNNAPLFGVGAGTAPIPTCSNAPKCTPTSASATNCRSSRRSKMRSLSVRTP